MTAAQVLKLLVTPEPGTQFRLLFAICTIMVAASETGAVTTYVEGLFGAESSITKEIAFLVNSLQ